MINRENYINIQGWMVTDLGLKGNELLIYAIIYGFSQDGESEFNGSASYLAEWTNSTKRGIFKSLKKLVEKNLILKKEVYKNKVKFVYYQSTKFIRGDEQSSSGIVNKVHRGDEQSSQGGDEQSSHNNIDNNKLDNIYSTKYNQDENQDINQVVDIDIDIDKDIKLKELKNKKEEKYLKKQFNMLGEFQNVKLTEEQIIKLKGLYGQYLNDAIEIVSSYVQSTGKKYKDFYAVLGKHNWVYKKMYEEKIKNDWKDPYTYAN